MTYVLDTNIILFSILNPAFELYYKNTYRQSNNDLVISAVTEGELKSLALKRKWGKKKTNQLLTTLQKYISYPVKLDTMMNAYAQIDAYSQGCLENKPLPVGITARNMGKNDLWIAATTFVVNGTLITADKDFNHLAGVYFPIHLIDINDFKS